MGSSIVTIAQEIRRAHILPKPLSFSGPTTCDLSWLCHLSFPLETNTPLPPVSLNTDLPVKDQVQTVAVATVAIQSLYQCLKKA